MKHFLVIGNPIAHSLSPKIHNHAIRFYNLDAFYSRILLPQDIHSEFLREFIFSSNINGINITLPFKEIAYKAIDILESTAEKIGAINTIVNKDSKLYGYNTDAEGFYMSIKDSIKDLGVKNALILGAGGSAKAIAVILDK